MFAYWMSDGRTPLRGIERICDLFGVEHLIERQRVSTILARAPALEQFHHDETAAVPGLNTPMS
jgi:hypothetical protein